MKCRRRAGGKLIRLAAAFLFLTLWIPAAAHAACSSPAGVEKDMIYNTNQKIMQYCNGTSWVRMNKVPGSGSGGCTTPTAAEGAIIFNTDQSVMQVCAGNVWRAMGPIGGSAGALWNYIGIGSDRQHNCAIRVDGTIWCWGANYYAELGLGYNLWGYNQHSPVQESSHSIWKQVAMSMSTTCAIKSDDTLWCWGQKMEDNNGYNANPDPVQELSLYTGWKAVSLGGENGWNDHACAIKADDTLWCWGGNDYGMLGIGVADGVWYPAPQAVSGGYTWKMVSAAYDHTCAIKSDDTLWCWGGDGHGQLGNGAGVTADQPAPYQVGVATWKYVDAGYYNTCAVKMDGTLWCWGTDWNSDFPSPVADTSGATDWASVTAGVFRPLCALKNDGTLYCLDCCTSFLTGGTLSAWTPGTTWLQVRGGSGYGTHTCGLRSDHHLFCWGWDNRGVLGDGATTGDQLNPVQEYTHSIWTGIDGGRENMAALRNDNTIWSWGNMDGHIYQDANLATDWKSMSHGNSWTCGIKANDHLYCWGQDYWGVLGISAGDDSTSTATEVNGGGTWKMVDATAANTCGIKSDDSLWCWGANTGMGGGAWQGMVGDGTTTSREIPTHIGSDSWKYVATGTYETCGIKMDDTMWCWGYDGYTNSAVLSPVERDPGHTYKFVGLSPDYEQGGAPYGIRTDGTLMTWDYSQPVPYQAQSGSWIRAITTRGSHCGIKSDNTLWCWGYKDGGQLGNGEDSSGWSDTAIPIVTGSRFKEVAATSGSFCALEMNGTLLCWGSNFHGSTGQGTWIATSSPSGVSCSDPAGTAGKLIYNSVYQVMQYCDGSGWVTMGLSGAPATPSAAYITTDTTNKGSWSGVYGTEGVIVSQYSTSNPSYATVTIGGTGAFVWAASTADVRGVQKPNNLGDRIAGTWYTDNDMYIDINVSDHQTHKVTVYFLDWDVNGRSTDVSVLNASTSAVLDGPRTISSYDNGKNVRWTIGGHVKIKIHENNPGSNNSTISAIYFDP